MEPLNLYKGTLQSQRQCGLTQIFMSRFKLACFLGASSLFRWLVHFYPCAENIKGKFQASNLLSLGKGQIRKFWPTFWHGTDRHLGSLPDTNWRRTWHNVELTPLILLAFHPYIAIFRCWGSSSTNALSGKLGVKRLCWKGRAQNGAIKPGELGQKLHGPFLQIRGMIKWCYVHRGRLSRSGVEFFNAGFWPTFSFKYLLMGMRRVCFCAVFCSGMTALTRCFLGIP
jgi:hypothetical protein